MTVRDWALVAFTLLMQTSVGVLLIVSVLHPFVPRATPQPGVRAFDLSLLVAAACATLALVASLAHLGQPLQAWLAAANVRTSWLSREVALAVVFTAAIALVAVLFRADSTSPLVRGAACIVTVALGIALVYTMARLYMVPAQPAWNRIGTPLGFVATALVLGALVVFATGPAAPFTRALLVVALLFLVLQMVLVPTQVTALVREPAAAISSASVGHLAAWLAIARTVLALAATVLVVTLLLTVPVVPPAWAVASALVLVFASEILGRVLFYAAAVRI